MHAIRSDLHIHTTFSDGQRPPEDYVQAALEQGLVSLGFSEHAPAWYDTGKPLTKERVAPYFAEIQRLKEKYAGQIEIYLGLENDCFDPYPLHHLDYVIGSVHYVQDEEGNHYCIDSSVDAFEEALDKAAGGDVKKLASLYYGAVAATALTQRPDILGHLDMLVKLNGGNRFFDPDSHWHLELTGKAVEAVSRSGCVVEVNTGGMSRGYTDSPYPSKRILRQLKALEVPLTLSSDAHQPEYICACFEETEALLREVGYTRVMRMEKGRLIAVPL